MKASAPVQAGAPVQASASARNAVGVELVLARASAAARGGDLDEADRLLRDLEATAGPSLAQLDLLARVCAQRGDVAAADACWTRVQATDPESAAAAAGRQLIAEISAGRSRARPVLRPVVSLVAAVSACAALAGAVIWAGVVAPAVPSAGPGGDATMTLRETQRADALTRQLAAQQAEHTNEVARAATIDALARNLTIPGVRVDQRPDGVEVVFDQGLFSRGDRLTAAGMAKLAELGRRLAGQDVPMTVVGHAVSVSGGPAGGGSVVALARAAVAAQTLAEAGGAPLTSFTLRSGDQTRGPFPDPARNRTVTLLIVPDAETR